jgi:subtilisin family serine protease
MYSDFYTDSVGHGTSCAGIAAGLTYGHAKNAIIYPFQLNDPAAPNPNYTMTIAEAYDFFKGWQALKPNDPVTGHKRPTVLNMSYVFAYTYSSKPLISVTYRGTTYTTNVPLSQYGMIGPAVAVPAYEVDQQEMLDAGIIMVGASGNYSNISDVPAGLDYNNTILVNDPPYSGIYYYMRGCWISDVISVGNVSTDSNYPEEKASDSNRGPRIDVWAPGTDTVSTSSNTNVFGITTQYPLNTSYKIGILGGTSMACPQIAGLCALLLQKTPTATPAQIRTAIKSNATPNVLYTTGQTTDYTNLKSLCGAPNLFAYNTYNSPLAENVNIMASGAIKMNNVSIISGP